MLQDEFTVRKKKGISYLYQNGKQLRHKPWLADIFSFLYDRIMTQSVIPKKLDASVDEHIQFLKKALKDIHNQNVLELASGSGNLAALLSPDNRYTGIDISRGLLKIAYKKFQQAGFQKCELFICGAEKLPFINKFYDTALCNLSLNFFDELDSVIKELKRVMKNNSLLIASVPVPERNVKQNLIRGQLFTEEQLKSKFETEGFNFIPYDFRNGTILYFKAIL